MIAWLRRLLAFRDYSHRRQVVDGMDKLLPKVKQAERLRRKAREHVKARKVAKVIQLHQKDKAS